jgi:molybdenum cofactor synthesis domain-containing protein
MTAGRAAVLVVGSEVLSGKVSDENGPFLVKRLRELGTELVSLHVVPDRMDVIVEALLAARRRAAWVLTSGGVGPTHDDLTLPAVARALGRPLRREEGMVTVLRTMHARHHPGEGLPQAALRMADLPEGTRLLGDPEFPTLVVEGVAMLPGVPSFLRHQFERIAPLLRGAPFHLVCLYLGLGEDRIAAPLDRVAREHPDVEIGSYPRFDVTDHRVRVTLEGRDAASVRAAARATVAELPAGAVLRTEGLER